MTLVMMLGFVQGSGAENASQACSYALLPQKEPQSQERRAHGVWFPHIRPSAPLGISPTALLEALLCDHAQVLLVPFLNMEICLDFANSLVLGGTLDQARTVGTLQTMEGFMPRQKTREGLLDRIDELEAENETLQDQVDSIAEIIEPEEDEDKGED